ncbi:hypothetical protein GXW82_13855 [Streptacidiphilus sp. 4-A2]|nr:hypothetical protein [Streptacidiphilus sp. 4-A2]
MAMTAGRREPELDEETILHAVDEPIFTALARQWSDAGRSVPGRADREWTELVGWSPWPRAAHRRRGDRAADGLAPPVPVPRSRRAGRAADEVEDGAVVVNLFPVRREAPDHAADGQVCTCP